MTEAKAICDSIGEHSPRLLAIRAVAPKFIHQETLRHRLIYIEDALRGDYDFSLSVSSSRAIPFQKMLMEVRDPHRAAKPVLWGKAQRGMSPGEEIDDTIDIPIPQPVIDLYRALGIPVVNEYLTKRELAESLWDLHAELSATIAEIMDEFTDAHKSISNRLIETHVHCHALMTATAPGWLNFFGLRLDSAADPTLRALAEACWVVWNESEPKLLKPGQWHLPFIDAEDDWNLRYEHRYLGRDNSEEFDEDAIQRDLKRISVARSAHLSYESFENPGTRMSIEKCFELHDRFVNSRPIHASPMEHQAAPDRWLVRDASIQDHVVGSDGFWEHPKLHGNIPGWIQYRKTLSDEAIAPLPKGYEVRNARR